MQRYPCGEMAGKSAEKPIALVAKVTGEMSVDDVPVASWANLDALKGDDPDPYQVVMAVPAGKSTRGWNYTPQALQRIVGEVNASGLPAFLGHQKPDDVSTEFPNPVTHWIGAKWQDGVAYFRGLLDKSATDLKRWVRGNAINQVSIFGYPQLEQKAVTGETDVTDYKPLSIDWTPLNRAGMPTKLVASGEMDVIATPADDSHEALKDSLRGAAKESLGVSDQSSDYVWPCSVYDDYFVAGHESNGSTMYYKFPYDKNDDGTVTLGDKVKVQKVESWEPCGEMNKGGNGVNELEQLITAFKAGKITKQQLQQACGEIGITIVDPGTVNADAAKTLTAIGEMFGGASGEALINAIKGASEAVMTQKQAQHDAVVSEVIGQKVTGEMAQGLVKKMLRVPADATKEVIAGEIDKVLADETVRGILAQAHIDLPMIGNQPTGEQQQYSGVRVRHSAI